MLLVGSSQASKNSCKETVVESDIDGRLQLLVYFARLRIYDVLATYSSYALNWFLSSNSAVVV